METNADGSFGWVRNFPNAERIAVDDAGNVIVAGEFTTTVTINTNPGTISYTPIGGVDVVAGKFNGTNGNYIWSGQIGGNNGGEEVWAIATDDQNSFYLTGPFSGTGDFDPNSGEVILSCPINERTTWFAKFNAAGGTEYVKALNGTGADYDSWSFSIATDDQDLYIGGRFQGTIDFDPGAGTYDLVSDLTGTDSYVVRLDRATGNFKWAGRFGLVDILSTSQVEGLVPLGGGEVIVAGSHQFRLDADPGPCESDLNSNDGGNDIYALRLSTGAPLPVPTFTSFTPTSGPIGTPVTLTGTNFNPVSGDNTVQFNTSTATISSNTTTTINTSVPATATTGKVKVTAYCTTLTSAADFIVTGNPTITSLSPTNGPVGTTVQINGTNFSTVVGNNIVKFNGLDATIISATTTRITATVPVGATTGRVTVAVGPSAVAQSPTNFTVTTPLPPTITGFTPANGPVGTTVVITGTNFSTTLSNNIVRFNGTQATVVSGNSVQLVVQVPVGSITGKITVTIAANTATSASDFTVEVALIIVIHPESVEACSYETANFVTQATGTSNIRYQWQHKAFSSANFTDLSDGNGVSGSSSTELSVSPASEYEGDFRCQISGDGVATITTQTVGLYSLDCGNNPDPPVVETQLLETVTGGKITLDLLPLITYSGNGIGALSITSQPPSGAIATISETILTIDYEGIDFSGKETVGILACDQYDQCTEQTFEIEVAATGDIIVYNAVSPGGANPTLIIQGITQSPETSSNSVTIFDRWQNVVWSGNNYNNADVVFKGTSDGGKELPTGTYYYKIDFASSRKDLTGFISLKR